MIGAEWASFSRALSLPAMARGLISRRISADVALAGVLVVLCLTLYLPGITWGVPPATHAEFTRGWGNDDLVPLPILAEMDNTFRGAKPDRNIAYPWFDYFLVACAMGPYLAYLFLTGAIAHPVNVYPFGLSDPVTVFRNLSWLGRSVTLLLAIGTVLGSYLAGRYLWGRTAGFLGATFTALMFPMAYYARLGNPDVPSLGWTSLALAFIALSIRRGLTSQRGAWMGLFVALAFSTKLPFGSFLLVGPAVLWIHIKSRGVDHFRRWSGVWVAPAATAASFVLAYVFASGIPADPHRFIEHITHGATLLGQFHVRQYPATPAGYADATQAMIGYLIDVLSWPGFVAAVIGIGIAMRSDRPSLTLALSALGFFLMVLFGRIVRLHYLLPVALPLNLFIGYAFARGLRAGTLMRMLTSVAVLATVGVLLLETVDLTHDMLHDSRYDAGAWLDGTTSPGDRVLFFDPPLRLPPLRPDVQVIQVFLREEARSTILEAQPDFIIINPDDTNEESQAVEWRYGPHSIYSDYVNPDLFRDLSNESLGYRLVAQFQTPRLMPWLDRPFLTYPSVNPPFHIFARIDRLPDAPRLEPWATAPYNPRHSRVNERTVDRVRAGLL